MCLPAWTRVCMTEVMNHMRKINWKKQSYIEETELYWFCCWCHCCFRCGWDCTASCQRGHIYLWIPLHGVLHQLSCSVFKLPQTQHRPHGKERIIQTALINTSVNSSFPPNLFPSRSIWPFFSDRRHPCEIEKLSSAHSPRGTMFVFSIINIVDINVAAASDEGNDSAIIYLLGLDNVEKHPRVACSWPLGRVDICLGNGSYPCWQSLCDKTSCVHCRLQLIKWP